MLKDQSGTDRVREHGMFAVSCRAVRHGKSVGWKERGGEGTSLVLDGIPDGWNGVRRNVKIGTTELTHHLIRPTAKYWLYFSKGYPNRQNPEALPKTVAK